MRHYSKKEVAIIKDSIRNGEKPQAASKRLAQQFGRPASSVYMKIINLRKRTYKKRTPAKVTTTPTPMETGVRLDSGFVFDFKPRRAEMHKDHVRIYF
jgi:hypothetical protein